MFGFDLKDGLIAGFFMAVGLLIVRQLLAGMFPPFLTETAGCVFGFLLYLAVAAPIYRTFRWRPMIHPRCQCCRNFQAGFYYTGTWPRIVYKCPTCTGEFIIWFNGKVGNTETWDKPVLALKWPYVLGRYKKMNKPTASDPKQAGVSG
jgi:hypothetical protein